MIPSDGNPTNVQLISEDGMKNYTNGDNTQPLGATSDYLKIDGAGCKGCCDLSAAFDKLPCSPSGSFAILINETETTESITTSMHITTTTTTTAKPTSTVETTQQPTGIINYLVRIFDFQSGLTFDYHPQIC